MIENSILPAGRPEWRRLMHDPFTFANGHVITGNEAIVYQRPDLLYVVKEFIDERAIDGYQVAMEFLTGLLAQTAFIENRKITVDRTIRTIAKGVVQERVAPLENRLVALVKERSRERLIDLINQKAALDKKIMQRGVYIQDPELKNYGEKKSGEVVLIDPGRAVTDPSQDELHLTRVVNRGWTHYSIYMRLQDWGEHQLADTLRYSHELSDIYREATGLTFDPKINASTHLHLQIVGDMQDLANFIGMTLGNLAQEELKKFFPKSIPNHQGIATFGTGYLD